jgi:hypothetical protein
MTLGFAQLCLTGMFQTLVPYAYLTSTARDDAQVADGLSELQKLSEASGSLELSSQELESRARIIAPLFERVPWAPLGFLASLLIYPLLGRMAGRYLSKPESSGLLILLSAGMGQNPATIPMSLQYAGMGQIALPLPTVIAMVLFQFAALAAGIMSHPQVQESQ